MFKPNALIAALGAQALAQFSIAPVCAGVGAPTAFVDASGGETLLSIAPTCVGVGAPSAFIQKNLFITTACVGVGAPAAAVSSASGSAHRYWRILVNEFASATTLEIAEIEMRATVGGADLCTGGTPSVSTGTAANAFDNSTATSWSTSTALPQWIAYDFGAPVSVVELYMYPDTNSRAPTDFEVQYSDNGSAWTTQYHSLDNGGQDWATGVARRWYVAPEVSYRIIVTNNNGGGNTRFAEIEFRAVAAGADQTTTGFPGPSARGSNTTNMDTVDRLFANDGNTTSWEPAASTAEIRYDFPTFFELAQYTILVTGLTSGGPRDWTVEKSIDGGQNWTLVDTRTSITWTANETKTFTI